MAEIRPLQKIVGQRRNEHGVVLDVLECGHEQHERQDIIGPTNATRRRCQKCGPPTVHAFCETIAASTTHIRVLSSAGPKYGGGADTRALCGAKASWDTKTPFSEALVRNWSGWPYPLCKGCRESYVAGLEAQP